MVVVWTCSELKPGQQMAVMSRQGSTRPRHQSQQGSCLNGNIHLPQHKPPLVPEAGCPALLPASCLGSAQPPGRQTWKMLWQSYGCQVSCRDAQCQVWAAWLCAQGHAGCLVHSSGETESLTLFVISRHVNPHPEDSMQANPVEPSLMPGGWS